MEVITIIIGLGVIVLVIFIGKKWVG